MKPSQVFFINLSTVPGLSSSTKARAAFRVDHAEVLTVDDFRDAVTRRSHRLYNQDNGQLMADYDRRKAMANPDRRLCMVVQRIYFHNGISAMMYNKNWYFEDDYTNDYSTQWKPHDWFQHLKDTVAIGKGWHRDDIYF